MVKNKASSTMGCNLRLFLFTVCTLQLISITERQVFDLLGYQWLPIAANFLHIIFVIVGFFGGYQFQKSYLITFAVWLFLWLAWNSFIICFYLDVGILDKNSEVLNLGTGAASWWEVNGVGCRPYFSVNGSLATPLHTNVQLADILRPPRPDWVDGCLLNYYYVEVIHAAVQLILGVFSLVSVFLMLRSYVPEEDTYAPKPRSRATSLYSVQYSSTRGRSSPLEDELELNIQQLNGLGPGNDPNHAHMTPRRVKRRSVSRSSGRHSRSSQRNRQANGSAYNGTASVGMVNEAYTGTMTASQSGTLASTRSNGRESLRKKRQSNNRIMNDSSTSNDSVPTLPAYFPSSHPNGGYPPPPPVNRDRMPVGNRHGPAPQSRPPAVLPSQSAEGHSNPLYQSSRPSSVYSISQNVEVDYRPPSAHSSYSNWHGQRGVMPLPGSSHHPNNLHGHSPTPSTATTNTFGVASNMYDVGPAGSTSGYARSAVYSTNYDTNYDTRGGQGHY